MWIGLRERISWNSSFRVRVRVSSENSAPPLPWDDSIKYDYYMRRSIKYPPMGKPLHAQPSEQSREPLDNHMNH